MIRTHSDMGRLTKRNAEIEIRVRGQVTDINLRERVAYCLLFLFALNTLGALLIVFLVGFGKMNLSDKIIITVLGETVAQAAAMFLTVTKYLFPASNSRPVDL